MSPELLEALQQSYQAEGYALPQGPKGAYYKPYRPRLNPIQGECYEGIKAHLYNLIWGERYSGKSIGALHALVDHCRENRNARGLIIVLTRRQGEEGGVWHKLNTSIRAEWERGGNAIFTEPQTNAVKDTFIWISNKFGGWSRIVLVSMPVEGFIVDRIKGTEWTFILVDEAQTLRSPTYFKHIIQQLGRDPGVAHQPVVYCCNPDGPSHWLYDVFFVKPLASGTWNENYFVKHVPLSDNLLNVPRNYIQNLIEATRGDETEFRRMVRGEWVDAPEGEALFGDDYSDEVHLKGDLVQSRGIIPVAKVPIIAGWDLGAAHSCVHFEQYIVTVKKIVWLIFDEFNYVDRYLPYYKLVPKIIERMEYWKSRAGHDFTFVHISDSSAFDQYRAKEGSYDYKDIQDLSGGVIRMKACPKGPGSVETRVRIVKEHLQQVECLVSATCPKTREMFMRLEEDPKARLKPKRSRFLHPFDSLSYPQLFYASGGRAAAPQVGAVIPQVYSVAA